MDSCVWPKASPGVYISVQKLYLFPLPPPSSENDIFFPSCDISFLYSHGGLFALILPYLAFILPSYFLFLNFFPLSSFFFPLSSFFFPLFLFPFFFFLHFPPFSLWLFIFFPPDDIGWYIPFPQGGGGYFPIYRSLSQSQEPESEFTCYGSLLAAPAPQRCHCRAVVAAVITASLCGFHFLAVLKCFCCLLNSCYGSVAGYSLIVVMPQSYRYFVISWIAVY